MNKDSIESAYCFLHQKQRVYKYSSLEWQKDDIEVAISEYADCMNRELYDYLANKKTDFLHNHSSFSADIDLAVNILSKLI